jgi:polysaccharide export outer membrane protein
MLDENNNSYSFYKKVLPMDKCFTKTLKVVIVLFVMQIISACSTNNLPTATLHSSNTTDINSYKYLIGAGDVLNIFVWRNPEVSGSFVVRPDGMITTSLVEDIKVSGKTPTELARSIEKILATYLRDPVVTVTVNSFVGPFSEQIRVIGEATEPQAINYTQHMTLLDVMIRVGGLTEFANGNGAVLVRMENGKQQQYDIMIDNLLKDGEINANVDMLPGDIIIIPEAWF